MTYASTIQPDNSRCLVCGQPETRDAPFVPVLTVMPGRHHWLHSDTCHKQHVERCAAERAEQARKATAA